MFSPIRENLLWSGIRATPFIYFFYIAMNAFMTTNYETLYFVFSYCCVFICNGILKVISKSVYNYLDVDYIFPFGQGSRPNGCTNSGTFLKVSDPTAISFGMPSGHSQLAWFFSTYLILTLIENNNNLSNKSKYKNFKIIALVMLATLVSYSRVYIEGCHTLGQVIVGGVLGAVMAYLLFKGKLYIKELL